MPPPLPLPPSLLKNGLLAPVDAPSNSLEKKLSSPNDSEGNGSVAAALKKVFKGSSSPFSSCPPLAPGLLAGASPSLLGVSFDEGLKNDFPPPADAACFRPDTVSNKLVRAYNVYYKTKINDKHKNSGLLFSPVFGIETLIFSPSLIL